MSKELAILGFAKSTIAAIDFLLSKRDCPYKKIKVSELKARENFDQGIINGFEAKGVEFDFGANNFSFIKDADLVLVSPGMPPRSNIINQIAEAQKDIVTDIDLFCEYIDRDYIAVTGTNGKTTTTSLLAHIFDTEAIGNIGKPVMSFEELADTSYKTITREIDENPRQTKIEAKEESKKTPYVLELSSFQLFYSNKLKAPKAAVYLNLTPDHLDWHSSLDEYRQAKEKLFLEQKSGDYAILNFDDPAISNFVQVLGAPERMTAAKSPWIRFFSTKSAIDWMQDSAYLDDDKLVLAKGNDVYVLARTDELKLVGEHNYSNILAAALAADSMGLPIKQISDRIKSFEPVEHRLEFVASIDAKAIYNDSKATNPESAIRAYESFEQSIAIVGGKDKNLDLGYFLDVLSSRAYRVVAIGEIKDKIKDGLEERGFTDTELADSLEDALDKALAIKEDLPIVFSPASSSFDMFTNFVERGKKFKEIVLSKGGVLNG